MQQRESVHERLEGSARPGVGFDGQRGRQGSRGRRVVPHRGLDEAKMHACLTQRRGRAMPEGVDRGVRMAAAVCEGCPEGLLHTGAWHGVGCRGHAEAATTRSGKEPDGMAVDFPVLAQQLQGTLWERHRAVLGACATAHVDEHPCTVNSRDLHVGAFLKPQATGRDGGKTHPIAQPFQVRQKRANLFCTEDDRQCLFPWGSDECQSGPWPLHGVLGEERDAAQGDCTCTARGVFDILEREEGVPEFFFRDPGR
jgi:hypothetical protein